MQRSNISNKTNMDDSYQQMFHTFQKSRVNRSTIWRRQLKERDPEKYRRYLDQQRVRSQIARNRLKSAINIAKNSTRSITNRFDRQRKLSSDKLRAYQWKFTQNSVDARILAKLATNVSTICEKIDEEPKIVLDKLADQLKVFKCSHILTSGLHMRESKTLLRVTSKYYWSSLTEDIKKWISECEVCQKPRQYQNEILELPNENPPWKETNSMETASDCGIWSREGIELLLRSLTQYSMMKPSHITSETELWVEISNKMKLLGSNTTSLQCQQKWQELKQKYVHLKMSKNSSESSNEVWPFLGVLNMMYYAFQNPRLEGSSTLPSPFDSVFAIDVVDGATSSVDILSSCDSHIIPDSFSSRIVLDNYRDVSSVDNAENLLQDHIDNRADRIWPNNVWSSSLRSEGEEDNQAMEKSLLKQISLEEEVCKQYWDNLESGSLSLQNSFRPPSCDNGSVITVLPSFNDDIHASVEVITDSELQTEIKKEADSSLEQITISSISVMEKANEPSWPSEDGHLGIFSIKMEPSNNEANLYMEIPTPQDLNPVSSTSVSSSTPSSSSSSSATATASSSSSSSLSSSSSSSVSAITPSATTTTTTTTTTSTSTTTTPTTIVGHDANGANLQNSDKIILGQLPSEAIGTKHDSSLELFCQQASVVPPEDINNICDSASDKDTNHDISHVMRLQDISSDVISSKSLQHNTTSNSKQSSPGIQNNMPPVTSHSDTPCLNVGVSGSSIFSRQNSEISNGLLTNKRLTLLEPLLPLGELRRENHESNGQDIPLWFQLYVQQCQHEAEIRERQLKDFQANILELFKETNEQLTTLIEVQETEKMRQQKKDEEFRSNLLAILQENLKK